MGTSLGTRASAQGRHPTGKCSLDTCPRAVPALYSGRRGRGGRSKVPLTWGVEHDEDRGVFLHKLVKVFIGQVINGAALICPGSLGHLGLWRLRTGRPKTGRAQSKPRGLGSPSEIQPPGRSPHSSRCLWPGLTGNPSVEEQGLSDLALHTSLSPQSHTGA